MHFVLFLFALSALAEDSPPPEALGGDSRLIVLADASDERIETVREALSFWFDTFAALRLEYPLSGMTANSTSPRRSFETYARSLSQQAGRNDSGAGPPAPPELLKLDAEIVVLLSQQKVMPFAWPLLGEGPHYFVALPQGADVEIAKHEIGHTLGLGHGRTTGLMCMPCAAGSARELSAEEREELRRLYRSDDP